METTRRSFIFGIGALSAVPLLPSLPLDRYIPKYVTYPHDTWVQEWDWRCFKHTTRLRVALKKQKDYEHMIFGLGMRLAKQDIVDNNIDKYLKRYNTVLENFREKYDFTEDMIYRAANDQIVCRWIQDDNGNFEILKAAPIRYIL